jgi:hypothetical protein
MFSANEPATETDPAAPEIASLEKLAPACVSASMSSDAAETGPAESEASLVTFANVIATPAPIAAEPPVAEPSAFDFAAAVCDDLSVSVPPTVMTSPAGSVALALAFSIVIATAAATVTPPEEVDAEGVDVPPEVAPPEAAAVESAWLRSPATCPSTPPAGVELDVPLADALAEPFVVLEPVAWSVAAPPTTSSRRLVALTSWFAMVTAIDAPIAAEDPDAEPIAVVVTEAV